MMKLKPIAFYLPQFYPTPENDEWWGKGFTEWTNVAKAKPLFKGHYQPKIPADLGFYDLRVPEVREQQAELAREAGVDGFCYWHYWFGNGKELLERPFKEVVESGKPDFPFCLGWANEDWQAKIWNATGTAKVKETLIKQEYPGEKDHILHFKKYTKAFKDLRYIRIDNKPVFLIYNVQKFESLDFFIDIWNDLIKKENIADEFFFIGMLNTPDESSLPICKKFSSWTLTSTYLLNQTYSSQSKIKQIYQDVTNRRFKRVIRINFSRLNQILGKMNQLNAAEKYIPTLFPNWDHSPRSGNSAIILDKSTPQLFQQQCVDMFSSIKNKKNKLIFLKSWNEWGEGNYMEPDLKHGKGYIKALFNALKLFK